MLKVRLMPTLLWRGLGLVKGVGFDSWRRVGPILPAIKVYNQRDVDELALLDVLANSSGSSPDFDSVAEFGRQCFVPLTVGGGITDVSHVQRLLRGGADKVSLNTALYGNPKLATAIGRIHGSQCVVASIDVRGTAQSGWECYAKSGTVATGLHPVGWARTLESHGAGELMVTSIDRDGTFAGYDLELIEAVAMAVRIPVIASGGAGDYEHFVQAVRMGASAVAAASMFHFTERTPAEAKKHMLRSGLAVRISHV